MTGAFVCIKRDGKLENIEIEYLSVQERIDLFKDKDKEEILKWLDLTCSVLCEIEEASEIIEAEIIEVPEIIEIPEIIEAIIFDSEGNIL